MLNWFGFKAMPQPPLSPRIKIRYSSVQNRHSILMCAYFIVAGRSVDMRFTEIFSVGDAVDIQLQKFKLKCLGVALEIDAGLSENVDRKTRVDAFLEANKC